mgnify:CR=1 FL=1
MNDDSVLFCIPLKESRVEPFQQFIADCLKNKSDEWKAMLARYDISSVKVWYKIIDGRDYVFVYHDIGLDFAEKIQGWNDSVHPFDQWFNEQIMSNYATDAASEPATSIVQLYVN